MRFDADAAEIEAVGIPAGCHGSFRHRSAFRMHAAGFSEQIEFDRFKDKETAAVNLLCEFRGTVAMVAIAAIMKSSGIVQDGEQLDDASVRPGMAGKHQTVSAHSRPVPDAVNAIPLERELLSQASEQLPGDQVAHRKVSPCNTAT